MTSTPAQLVPRITLNDGTSIPQLGFGTMDVAEDRSGSPESTEQTAAVVAQALEAGFRHFDSAQMYGNEQGVGLGIARSGLPRDEIYVTTKLGNASHRPDDVRRSFGESLEKLSLDRLDLFLMHWPLPTLYDGDFVSTWKAMAELIADGRLSSVGVSNFLPHHLERVIGEIGIVPVVNQIEVHPYFPNDAVREASKGHGVAVEAWSPLGQGNVLEDPELGKIAAAHGTSVSQVVLRWHLDRGDIVIPRSADRGRIEQNIDVFDFALSADEVARIDALDRGEGGRRGPNPDQFAWIPAEAGEKPR